ncbi:type VII secretion protein EccCa [Mycolicibacterium sphagni]|uniref:Type VII secretion protein EccCa n=1 Tax=Mycolicibacterium sphagni TaxID=1786 RepID=A0ABX2K0M5_9MYCO|nr:type VII secretion protein EccCa [Mycolicibacterium sphagni]NTY62527.1 type VII secretion protein EccCa [Mycolicibacterium sphagni]
MATVKPRQGAVKVPPTMGGKLSVPEPLEAPRPLPRSKAAIILPVVMGVAFLGMMALMLSQPGLRGGTMGMMSLFFPIMMIVSMGSYMFSNRGAGGDKQMSGPQLEQARRDYSMTLDETRDSVQAAARAQHAQFEYLHSSPALLSGLVGSARMWCRTPNDQVLKVFYTQVRMGLGTSKVVKELETNELGRREDYEPVTYDASSAFLQTQSKLHNAPKPLLLRNIAGMALIGRDGMEPVYDLARAMICQAAVAHSPRDFKIMIVTDDLARWEWCKWLPHCAHPTLQDRGGPARMLWTTGEQMDVAVGAELHNREAFRANSTTTPHWLVIDDRRRRGDDRHWETLTRAGGVAGVTFLALSPEPGRGLGFEEANTYWVSTTEVVHRARWFCRPDAMDAASARVLARKMARYRVEGERSRSIIDDSSVEADLYKILGIDDPGNLDVEKLWAPTLSGPPFENNPWGAKWLQFPIGVDPTGGPVYIDFKETHEGGMGHHMVIAGTTGSGKSSFLTTLILSAALTHSPETLVFAFFDFKGKTTANMVAGLPNVVAAMGNLKDDSLWIERMGDVINGELERRKTLLDRAGLSEVAEYEYRRIHLGQRLEPLPALIIVIDEFTQMFIDAPESKKIIDEIGRQGRALNVKMILGSQRLGHEMQSGIMANIPIRLGLRTLDAGESMAIIGTDEAKHLPEKPAGAGLLRVQGRDRLVRFQSAFARKVYHPPRRVVAEAVRAQAGYMAPEVFTAAPMAAIPSAPRPSAAPVQSADTMLGPDGQPIRELEASVKSLVEQTRVPIHQMWLPPLAPVPVEDLVRRLRRKPWYQDYGNTAGLQFPVGIEDRPFQHAQRVYALDCSSGNCAVIGRQTSGKTTALATIITGAAMMYHPRRVQFVVVAMGGTGLNEVEALPHVSSFARAGDRERVQRSIAEMKLLVEEREEAFSRLGMTIETFRARKFGGEAGLVPDDPFGEVFLVIDGWQQFRNTFGDDMIADLGVIMQRGNGLGVRTIIAAAGWIAGGFPSWMSSSFTLNVELALDVNDDPSRNNRDVAKKVPFGERELLADPDDENAETRTEAVRGRGTSMAGYHFQTALPVLTAPDGRSIGPREAAAVITELTGVDQVAAVRVLPSAVGLDEVFAARREPRHGVVPFGISEVGLVAAEADCTRNPHLMFIGNPECGLSNSLAAVAGAIMRCYRPEEAQLYVIDPGNSLVRVVQGPHLGRYIGEDGVESEGYTYYEDDVRAMVSHIDALLAPRMPRGRAGQEELAQAKRSWSGPEIFVVVDDEQIVAGWSSGVNMFRADGKGPAVEGLIKYIGRAREVGLHLIVGRRFPWGPAMSSPLAGRLIAQTVPLVVMDGERMEGELIRGVKAARQPVGRGIYVTDRLSAPAQIAKVLPVE